MLSFIFHPSRSLSRVPFCTFLFKPRRLHRPVRERFLLPEEWSRVRLVLDSCPLRVRTYFTLLVLLGPRRGELLTMQWQHLDLLNGIWHKPKTKNGRGHTLPLSPEAQTLLGQMPNTGRYVFVGDPDQNGTKPDHAWSSTSASFWWKKIRKVAGVPDVWIHDLRRTVGSWMAIHGENTKVIQSTLGHSSPIVTQRVYMHLNLDAVRQALTRHAERVMAR